MTGPWALGFLFLALGVRSPRSQIPDLDGAPKNAPKAQSPNFSAKCRNVECNDTRRHFACAFAHLLLALACCCQVFSLFLFTYFCQVFSIFIYIALQLEFRPKARKHVTARLRLLPCKSASPAAAAVDSACAAESAAAAGGSGFEGAAAFPRPSRIRPRSSDAGARPRTGS